MTNMYRLGVLLFITLFNNFFVGVSTRIISGCHQYEEVDTTNLAAVIVFMRHGVRAPWTTYPKDPDVNYTNMWPNGRSQLTEFGIQQASNVGELLTQRYGSFTKRLKRNQIYLRASASQRCIDTVNLVAKQMWSHFNHAHQPPIYSLPQKIDSLLYEEPICPDGDKEEDNNMHKPEVIAYESMPQIKQLYTYVANHTGLPPTMSGVTKAFDCVRCLKINGYRMPAWSLVNDTYERMGDVYSKNLNFLYASEKSQRIRAGPLLQEIIDIVNAIQRNDDTTRRVYIYTTHDYKLTALLLALGMPVYRYPAFAASIIFEIHKDMSNGEYIIKAYYVNQTIKQPYTIELVQLNKCMGIADYHCKANDFAASLQPYLNLNWTQACGLKSFDAIQVAEDDIGHS